MPLRTGSVSTVSNRTSGHSPAIPKLLQVGSDHGVHLRSLGLLLPQRRDEPPHLLLERLPIVLLRLGTDVAAGREHVFVLPNLLKRRAPAEPRHVGVLPGALLAAPRLIGAGDPRDVLIRQLAVG